MEILLSCTKPWMCQPRMFVCLQVVLGDVLESEGQATAEEFNTKYGRDVALYVYSDVTKQDSVDGGWRHSCQFWHPWRKNCEACCELGRENNYHVCLLPEFYNTKVCKQLGFCRNSGKVNQAKVKAIYEVTFADRFHLQLYLTRLWLANSDTNHHRFRAALKLRTSDDKLRASDEKLRATYIKLRVSYWTNQIPLFACDYFTYAQLIIPCA